MGVKLERFAHSLSIARVKKRSFLRVCHACSLSAKTIHVEKCMNVLQQWSADDCLMLHLD